MPKLYIITGPAGVGKSTVSKQLASNLQKSALIEGDSIYNQVVGGYVSAWKEGNHLELFKKICINNIKIYLQGGYDVIFNYIVTPLFLKELRGALSEFDMKFISLMVDEKQLIERDSQRPKECQMKERCIILLNNFKNYNYEEKYILDTTSVDVKNLVYTIIESDRFKL